MNQSTTSFTDLQPLTFWRVGTYWATAAQNRLQLFEGLGHSLSYLHEQYLEDFLNLKAERDKVFLGSGLVGGEYTDPDAMV